MPLIPKDREGHRMIGLLMFRMGLEIVREVSSLVSADREVELSQG